MLRVSQQISLLGSFLKHEKKSIGATIYSSLMGGKRNTGFVYRSGGLKRLFLTYLYFILTGIGKEIHQPRTMDMT